MPVIYKSFQSVLANKEGKKLFYPRVVLTGNVDTEQVAKDCLLYTSGGDFLCCVVMCYALLCYVYPMSHFRT